MRSRSARNHCQRLQPPPPPPPPPQPPQPPPLAELIQHVLAVPIEIEGQMSEAEALAILNVTHKSSKWLLLQLRPADKHPHHVTTKPKLKLRSRASTKLGMSAAGT